MDEESARETHAITQKLLDVLNESEARFVGTKLDAVAFAAAWMLLNIGGTKGFNEATAVFFVRIHDIALQLGPDEIATANATHQDLVDQAERASH